MNKHVDSRQQRPVIAERAGLTVRRVGANLGAEVTGVDLRTPVSDETRDAIEDALVESELLIFRNQDISSQNLMDFGHRFGELSVHPFAPNDENVSVLIKFRNDETNPPFRTDVWHSDETFRAEPPKATLLVAKEVPEIGGDTMFASMSAAFEGLSDRMQNFVSGLEAIHDFKPFRELFDDSEEDRKNVMRWETLYPPCVHPVVRIHPVSGRKVLFVNPQFTIAIKNMDERESRSLLDTLFQQAQIPEYQFRHHWAPHTLVMWDNRSTQHYAVNDYFPQRRYMERVTVRGGPVTGRRARRSRQRSQGHSTGRRSAARPARQAASPDHARKGRGVIAAMIATFRAIALAAVALVLGPCGGFAQAWPSRPVTVMVPFPAGGTADLLAREIAQAMSEELGQQFIVENRAGAGGNLAGAAVAKSTPDGASLLFASQAQAALNKFTFKNAPYDPVRELVPAVLVVKLPLAIIAGERAPVTSFQQMVEHARTNPGKLTVGHPPIGSMGHIALELVQEKTAIKLTGVPYRGGAPLVTDLLGGHVQLCMDLLANFIGLAKDGKVRVLAATSAGRIKSLPEVPAIAEQIRSAFEATAWFAIMAPAGTPADILQKINGITNRYLQSAKGKDLIGKQEMEAAGGTPADAAAFIKLELEKWEPIIKAAKISLD